MTNEERERFFKRIIKYYEKGLSFVEIGKKTNCSPSTIAIYLIRLGIHKKKSRKISNEDVDRIIDAYYEGLDEEEISEKYGYSLSVVKRVINESKIVSKDERKEEKRICNLCGKEFYGGKFERFCVECRRLAQRWDYQEYSIGGIAWAGE